MKRGPRKKNAASKKAAPVQVYLTAKERAAMVRACRAAGGGPLSRYLRARLTEKPTRYDGDRLRVGVGEKIVFAQALPHPQDGPVSVVIATTLHSCYGPVTTQYDPIVIRGQEPPEPASDG